MLPVQSKRFSKLPAEGFVQQRLFEIVEGDEFLAVDGFEMLYFFLQPLYLRCNQSLFFNRWPHELEILNLCATDVRNTNSSLNIQKVTAKGLAAC